MRFRLGFVTGFAAGYYLGAKAGRQRYEEIRSRLEKVRTSETFEKLTDTVAEKVDTVAEKVKEVVPERFSHKADDTSPAADGSPNGTSTIPAAAPLTGQPTIDPPPSPYSSSK